MLLGTVRLPIKFQIIQQIYFLVTLRQLVGTRKWSFRATASTPQVCDDVRFKAKTIDSKK